MPKAPSSKGAVSSRARKSSRSKIQGNTSKKGIEAEPEPVDETNWPASTISETTTINKARVKSLYRLNDEDIAGLKYTRTLDPKTGMTMKLYKEREVERVAWRKARGPEKFHERLDQLKAKHEKKQQSQSQGKRTEFKAPSTYHVVPAIAVGPGDSDLEPDFSAFKWKNSELELGREFAALLHKNWTRTPVLKRLYVQFPPWLWLAMLAFLGEIEFEDEGISERFNDSEKCTLLELALQTLPKYPTRPLNRLPSSRSVDALRVVLAAAPKKREHEYVDGVEEHTNYGPSENTMWWWADSYLRNLFPALVAVIREHGVGQDGWETVRWEVYDKYTECIGGIEYVDERRNKFWCDTAQTWLCGRTIQDIIGSQERKSDLSKAYVALLPFTDLDGQLLERKGAP